mgnify:FL=1
MTECHKLSSSVKTTPKHIGQPPSAGPDARGLKTRPLSNRVIADRHPSETAVKIAKSWTTGTARVFPSMLVVVRDRSIAEDDWYALLSRWGKSKNKNGVKNRGKIDHFTPSARFRMLKTLGTIGRGDPPFMLTLNYRSGMIDAKKAKRDLKTYRMWLDREYGQSSFDVVDHVTKTGFHTLRKRYKYKGDWGGVWRYEVTTGRGTRAKAKTPHFHILIWYDAWHELGEHDLDQVRDLLAERWCRITGDIDEDRLKYGCRLDKSQGDQTKIKNYMLGHHGKKTDQEACGDGKHWGILNSDNLALNESSDEVALLPKERARLARIVAKLIAKRMGRRPRDISSVDQIHAVLSPWDIRRILEHLKEG